MCRYSCHLVPETTYLPAVACRAGTPALLLPKLPLSPLTRAGRVFASVTQDTPPSTSTEQVMKTTGSMGVVTGAASGIGRAVALELTRRGVKHLAWVDFSETIGQ